MPFSKPLRDMSTPTCCKVHESCEECVLSQMSKLQIAVALVVLRDKPNGQSAKDFATSLRIFQQTKVYTFPQF